MDPKSFALQTIADEVNKGRLPWKKVQPRDVEAVVTARPGSAATVSVDAQQIIAVAKLFCDAAGVICPFIQNMVPDEPKSDCGCG